MFWSVGLEIHLQPPQTRAKLLHHAGDGRMSRPGSVNSSEFNRLRGVQTGELLIEALRSSPHKQVLIEPSGAGAHRAWR